MLVATKPCGLIGFIFNVLPQPWKVGYKKQKFGERVVCPPGLFARVV